jgi:glycosyltransferase involved in cell wall biosynthesis
MSNSYRKRPDILLKAFADFAKDKDDAKLLLQTSSATGAYPLRSIAKHLNISDKIIFGESKLTNDKFNLLYNVFDVNVNTSMGEGFGLPLLEGAACKCPIICTEDKNLVDIWGESATYIKSEKTIFIPETTCVGLIPSI